MLRQLIPNARCCLLSADVIFSGFVGTSLETRLSSGLFRGRRAYNYGVMLRRRSYVQRRGFNVTPQSCVRSKMKWTPFEADLTKEVVVKMPKFFDGTQFKGPVPRNKIDESFARSSGPGGQRVNKVNTKVLLNFHVESADWLPKWVRYRLLDIAKNRVTKDGCLRVTSEVGRTQTENLRDAYIKLEELISKACELPKAPSLQTRIKVQHCEHKAKMYRLANKKFQSTRKRSRSVSEYS